MTSACTRRRARTTPSARASEAHDDDDDDELNTIKTPPTPCLWQAHASVQKTKKERIGARAASTMSSVAGRRRARTRGLRTTTRRRGCGHYYRGCVGCQNHPPCGRCGSTPKATARKSAANFRFQQVTTLPLPCNCPTNSGCRSVLPPQSFRVTSEVVPCYLRRRSSMFYLPPHAVAHTKRPHYRRHRLIEYAHGAGCG